MENMPTKFRFEQGPMMSAAHLTSEDGGHAFIFCTIPGGQPMFQFSPTDKQATTVVNAPTIENHKMFREFITERFA